MTSLPDINLLTADDPLLPETLSAFEGRITVLVTADGGLGTLARAVNKACRGAVARFLETETFRDMKQGEARDLLAPAGLKANAIQVIRLDNGASSEDVRRAGAAITRVRGNDDILVAGTRGRIGDLALGMWLRAYAFEACKSGEPKSASAGSLSIVVSDLAAAEAALATQRAVAEGVWFTRDLINLPANMLSTENFAERLKALEDLGVEIEVLDEAQLKDLGMTMLLGVGLGSETPTKVVVMRWNGGGDESPLALVGKGVVFDTGGISIKPAAGMEDMTMDMGGAGVVSGVMKTLALRKAKANIVGLVGLVENMPDGRAQRPGDIVTSMKGDTVEVINTDAEGRLVLGDVMWYAQERFKPSGMIDLATLTGAVIVALGHENAGVFSNDDRFCNGFLRAASREGEGAWRMPLGEGYAKLLKSEKADVRNVGGRWGGSVTAAEFLHRFVQKDVPWMHIDIAGVAQPATPTDLAPKGASGWGVMALDRFVRDRYEPKPEAPADDTPPEETA